MHAPPPNLTVNCPVCDGEVSKFYLRPHISSHSRRELLAAMWAHTQLLERAVIVACFAVIAVAVTTGTLMILEGAGVLP